jgi:hypothetical protein
MDPRPQTRSQSHGANTLKGPAGRASCAEGGHFVARIPCDGEGRTVVLPLVGKKSDADQREALMQIILPRRGTRVTK